MPDVQAIIEETVGQTLNVLDWRKRMKEGVIVDLKIKRWRARKKLTLEELGITPLTPEARDAYEELLSLGSKLLLPEATLKELDAIERSARLNLAYYAYQTPFGYFVPYSTYPQWKEKNEEYKRLFLAKRDEIVFGKDQYGNTTDADGQPIKDYQARVNELLDKYTQLSLHSYQLMQAQGVSSVTAFPDANAYAQHFREEIILRHIKKPEDFYESFVYQEQLSRVPLLSNLDTEETSDEEITEVMTTKQAEIKAAKDRDRLLTEMNNDMIRAVRQQKQAMIDSFLSSLVAQLRSMTYDAVTSVLASIKEQETLQGRPVIQLKHLITQLGDLNFYGDADIDRILTTLHSIIQKPAKERDIGEITRQLRSIATLTRGTILALGETPREGKETTPEELGLSLVPTDEEIREARAELAPATATILPQSIIREEREERTEQSPLAYAQEEQRLERSE